MFFKIFKSSDYVYNDDSLPCKEINSLEELIEFQKECKHAIILYDNTIEIYDDWRE